MTVRYQNLMKTYDSNEEKNKIDDLMTETFLARRQALLNSNTFTVKEMKDAYPKLFERGQFWAEVDRIAGEQNWLEGATAKMGNWMQKVAQFCVCGEGEAVDELQKILGGEVIVAAGGGPTVSPIVIQDENECVVVVQGEPVLHCASKVEALIAWCAAHSVLNVKFGKKNKNVGLFLQKMVLNIDDGVKIPKPVMQLLVHLSF